MIQFKINWKLFPLKLHYFLWNAGTGPVVPYLTIYARQIGFSSVVVGFIYMILPICGLIIKPTAGAISDRLKCQKLFFIISQVICAITFVCLFYSPKVDSVRKVNFACDLHGLSLTSLHNESTNECTVKQIEKLNENVRCKLNCDIPPTSWGTFCQDLQSWGIPNVNCATPQSSYELTPIIPTKNITITSDSRIVLNYNKIALNGKNIFCDNCSKEISLPCSIECNDYNLNDLISTTTIKDENVYKLYQFWTFLALMIVSWMAQAVAVSVGDAICFQMLDDHPERYGYQRLFGALGWGVITPITGLIVDYMSKNHSSKNYIVAFYMGAAILLLDAIVSCRLKHTQTEESAGIWKDIAKLLAKPRILIYFLWCISVGLCTALMWNFFLWLIEDLSNAQGCDSQEWIKTLEGLVMAIQCLGGELPFFFLSGWILKKIGHINAMTMILGVIGVRLCLYSVIKNPWWFLPIEFSNGLTFGLFYATMASYASIVAPAGTDATMQGLVSAIFEGIGVSLGSFIAGFSFEKIGGQLTFRYFGIGALIACLLHLIAQIFLNKKEPLEYIDETEKESKSGPKTYGSTENGTIS